MNNIDRRLRRLRTEFVVDVIILGILICITIAAWTVAAGAPDPAYVLWAVVATCLAIAATVKAAYSRAHLAQATRYARVHAALMCIVNNRKAA